MKKGNQYNNYKYKVWTRTSDGATIVRAFTTFARKKVTGTAVCSAKDQFDEELGKKIAAARCNEKVAELRVRYADRKLEEVRDQLHQVQLEHARMKDYFQQSRIDYIEASERTCELEKHLSFGE